MGREDNNQHPSNHLEHFREGNNIKQQDSNEQATNHNTLESRTDTHTELV